ncbi:hypothetical protein DL767_010028 [Monosporascus sp. MG133]|nr:hypothetical protein DL767_010028 [Monosporascus sp. MG133]
MAYNGSKSGPNGFFQVAREKDTPFGSLHQLPLPAQPRILDIGCGTGIWAIDMADRYNSSGVVAAEVIGWDLALIQPQRIPPGLMFEKRDVEDMPWRGVNRDYFDLIHVQMLLGSIGNWPALYGQILRHLKPGSGILEQVEIDLRPRSEKGELPGNTKLSLWTRELSEAFDRAGTPLSMDPKTQALLEDVGFVDVKQETKRVPCNAWPDDEHEKDMGRWFNLALTQGLQAMSYGPLTRKLHYNKDQVDALVAEVRREICDRNLRAYCTMCVFAQQTIASSVYRANLMVGIYGLHGDPLRGGNDLKPPQCLSSHRCRSIASSGFAGYCSIARDPTPFWPLIASRVLRLIVAPKHSLSGLPKPLV